MPQRKIFLVICGLALVLVMGATTAFAASAPNSDDNGRRGFGGFRQEMENMTDEQKAELETEMAAKRAEMNAEMEAGRAQMEEKMAAAKEKWAALTDGEKEEIYALYAQMAQIQEQLADKYYELGLISADEAAQIKERCAEWSAAMGEDGATLMPGGLYGMHGGIRGIIDGESEEGGFDFGGGPGRPSGPGGFGAKQPPQNNADGETI